MECLARWEAIFPGSFYLELQRVGRDREEDYIDAALDLAAETRTPVVATNDVRFIKQDDFEAHEVRVCINDRRTLDDPRRSREYTDQQYLKDSPEMLALFEDIPSALENSLEIAKRCSLSLDLGTPRLPNYPVPDGLTMEDFFSQISADGLKVRLANLYGEDYAAREGIALYWERLEFELKIINQMGFAGYFLIVMEFIQWSKDNGIPVGPGRGSGAGSIVAYALKITDLDPLKYDLLFERFLNPERVSMPDFDVDFCMEGRDRVIQHVAELYGKEAVSQIITFGTLAAKAVVRDVARVQGQALGQTPRFKHVPVGIMSAVIAGLSTVGALSPRLRDKAELARIGRYYATESMLVWDDKAGRYDADATPEFGTVTLADHYKRLATQYVADDRGVHAVF